MNVLYQMDSFQNFTEAQKTRVELMRRIAQTVTETTKDSFVLKGGTALLLAYGLPRYSTDLDYDGKDKNADTVDWNDQTKAEEWRAVWAGVVNDVLARHNKAERIDHRISLYS